MADLSPALGPAAVAPMEAGLDQAGLPLLHLGGTGPPVPLRSLDHRSPPPQFPCRRGDGRRGSPQVTKTAVAANPNPPERVYSGWTTHTRQEAGLLEGQTQTCQPTRVGALGPRRPVRQLAVDGTFHHTGSIHLPFPVQAQLEETRGPSVLLQTAPPAGLEEALTPTSLQKLRSTDLPSLRTQSSMRVFIPLPHTARSLSWQVLQSGGHRSGQSRMQAPAEELDAAHL